MEKSEETEEDFRAPTRLCGACNPSSAGEFSASIFAPLSSAFDLHTDIYVTLTIIVQNVCQSMLFQSA